MRQNTIKVEQTNKLIQFVDCDSSDISEQHILVNQENSNEHYHQKLITLQSKVVIKQIELGSEQRDNIFYVYKIKDNGGKLKNLGFVVSKRKQTSTKVAVNLQPMELAGKTIYFTNKDV